MQAWGAAVDRRQVLREALTERIGEGFVGCEGRGLGDRPAKAWHRINPRACSIPPADVTLCHTICETPGRPHYSG